MSTTVACTDDPAIIQRPPAAPLDTLIGIGTGRYNNVDGFTIEFTLVDYGEPGRTDRIGPADLRNREPRQRRARRAAAGRRGRQPAGTLRSAAQVDADTDRRCSITRARRGGLRASALCLTLRDTHLHYRRRRLTSPLRCAAPEPVCAATTVPGTTAAPSARATTSLFVESPLPRRQSSSRIGTTGVGTRAP